MTPLKIVILGGTGFVGRHLLARLAADGHAVTLLSRNLACHGNRLLPPGVELREVDVYDPTVLRQAFTGSDAVINLVGILNERGDNGRGFRRAHVELTKLVIAAMQLAGVRRLLHDEGYTIKGVQKLHREQGIKVLMAAGAGEGAVAASPPPPPRASQATGVSPLLLALHDLETAKARLDGLLRA